MLFTYSNKTMKKTTKQALIARYENELSFLNEMIDLNIKNDEAIKQFQKQYVQIAKLLSELLNFKADDE
jgi:hypothetical protein